MPKLLTTEEYQFMTDIYNAVQAIAANRAVEQRFDFRTVLQNVFLFFKEEQNVALANIVKVYNSVFETDKSVEEFSEDNLNELFKAYLKQRLATKLTIKTKDTEEIPFKVRNSKLQSDADIFSMTCEQRDIYIAKFRLEGAVNLKAAQELQEQVLQKTRDVALDNSLDSLCLGFSTVCSTVAQFSGKLDETYSIAIEMQYKYEQAMKKKMVASIVDPIKSIIDAENLITNAIGEKPVNLGVQLNQAIVACRKAVADTATMIHALNDNEYVPMEFKDYCQEAILHMYDVTGAIVAMRGVLDLPAGVKMPKMLSSVINLLYESSKVELIDDVFAKDAYITALSEMFSKMLLLVITNIQKQKASVEQADNQQETEDGIDRTGLPTLVFTANETYMFEATGLCFVKLVADLMNKGRLKPEQLCDFISWLSLFQRSMSGPNLEYFMKIYTRVQQEFINSLNSEQARNYQLIFTQRYGAEWADKMGGDHASRVRMQQFCVDVLSYIDQRIVKLRKGLSI